MGRILPAHVTAHLSAHWPLQQGREVMPADQTSRFLIHDRDGIVSYPLDRSVRHLGLRVLRAPPQSPQTHALCARLLGTLRRACADVVMPLTEPHRRRLLHEWVPHNHEGRPHMSLTPGIPQLPPHLPVPLPAHRHRIPELLCVVARPILSGRPHEYCRQQKAA
jgi:putative transposase